MPRLRLILIALTFSPCLLLADTVEFIRGDMVNAAVTLQGDKFTLEATFAQGGKRKITVDRRYVANVVFNGDTANPGAATANFGVFTEAEAERFEMNTVDVLRLNDGDRLRGRAQAITTTSVIFSGEQIPRGDVKDLLMGSAVVR